MKSCSKMVLGLTQSSLKEKNNWPTATMAAAAFASVPSYPISGQLGTAHWWHIIWCENGNLLILNSRTGQSDMLVFLFSNDCKFFWTSWQRPTWNFRFVPSYPTKMHFLPLISLYWGNLGQHIHNLVQQWSLLMQTQKLGSLTCFTNVSKESMYF